MAGLFREFGLEGEAEVGGGITRALSISLTAMVVVDRLVALSWW